MKKSVLWLGGVFALAVGLSLAQSVAPREQAEAAPKPTEADLDWDALVEARPQAQAVNQLHPTDRAGAHLAHADRLEKFRKDHPDDSRSAATRAEEAHALIAAEKLGNRTERQRRDKLVEAVRQDPALSVKQRAEVVANAANFEVILKKIAGRDERLAEFEKVARRLIQDFPSEVGAWESLFRIGLSGSDASGVRIARDLVEMNAPEPIRAQAALFLARQELVGKPLVGLLAGAGFDGETIRNLTSDGTEAVFYTWSARNAASLDVARRIGATVPAGTRVIGLNLDTDIEAAALAATAAPLPGELLYDEKGREGALAKVLHLTSLPLVYRRDASGTISSVRALADFSPLRPSVNPSPAAP